MHGSGCSGCVGTWPAPIHALLPSINSHLHDLFCIHGEEPFPSGKEVHTGDPQSLAAWNVKGMDESGLNAGFGKAMVETNYFDDNNLKLMGREGGKLMGRIWKW